MAQGKEQGKPGGRNGVTGTGKLLPACPFALCLLAYALPCWPPPWRAPALAPILYLPSETELYFPLTDARYEAAFIPGVVLKPIPSLWGHTAGAAPNPVDAKFLNDNIRGFLAPAAPRR